MNVIVGRFQQSLFGLGLVLAVGSGASAPRDAAAQGGQASAPESVDFIRPVSATDHVRGSPGAPVKMIEFADTECPFCKRFHLTLEHIVRDYPGKVAWVFRHFPISANHPRAPKEAEATECAAGLGGNAKFWAYLDRLYEITPANNKLDPAELPRIATQIGLERQPFERCLQSGRYARRVADDQADALDSGGQGTPYTVVIAPNGRKYAILGAQPYATVKLVVDIALDQK